MQRSFVPSRPGVRGFPASPDKLSGAPGPVRGPLGNRLKPGVTRPPAGLPGARRPAAAAPSLRQQAAAPAAFTIGLLGFYIAMHTSFAGEMLAIFLHFPFPVVGIFAVIVPLVVLFAGKATRFFAAPVALPWLLLNGWMVLCAALSFYPRGSIMDVIPFELRFQILPILFCAVATTSKATRALLAWTAAGIIPALLLCATKGAQIEGRLGVLGTSLENPNDLAFHLLWGSMLLLVFLLGKGKLGKIVAVIAIPASVWFILKTASRANFLTIFAVVAIAFLLAAPSVRMILLLAIPIGLAAMLPFLPRATVERILAVVVSSSIDEVDKQTDASSDEQVRGALGSEAARMELAKLAVNATLRHPLFGVGMNMFATETADYLLKDTGKKAPWQTAHNSYLKISSENGVPALIFYAWSILSSIGMSWRTFSKARGRPGFEDATRNSVCILLALIVYAVGTFFCDIVYLPYLAITVSLAAANYLSFQNDDRLARAPMPMPMRVPSGVR